MEIDFKVEKQIETESRELRNPNMLLAIGKIGGFFVLGLVVIYLICA